MQIILLEQVVNLGRLGDLVNVKEGYARNFLLPFGKAVVANAANIEKFEARRAELEAKLAADLATATARAEKLAALEGVVIASKAGDEGKTSLKVLIADPTGMMENKIVSQETKAVDYYFFDDYLFPLL